MLIFHEKFNMVWKLMWPTFILIARISVGSRKFTVAHINRTINAMVGYITLFKFITMLCEIDNIIWNIPHN